MARISAGMIFGKLSHHDHIRPTSCDLRDIDEGSVEAGERILRAAEQAAHYSAGRRAAAARQWRQGDDRARCAAIAASDCGLPLANPTTVSAVMLMMRGNG